MAPSATMELPDRRAGRGAEISAAGEFGLFNADDFHSDARGVEGGIQFVQPAFKLADGVVVFPCELDDKLPHIRIIALLEKLVIESSQRRFTEQHTIQKCAIAGTRVLARSWDSGCRGVNGWVAHIRSTARVVPSDLEAGEPEIKEIEAILVFEIRRRDKRYRQPSACRDVARHLLQRFQESSNGHIEDSLRSIRASQIGGGDPCLADEVWAGNELMKFVCDVWQIDRLPSGAVFDDEVCVSAFLTGNRVDDEQRNSDRQGLGGGQSSGFGDDNVGGGHELMHIVHESHGNQANTVGNGEGFQGPSGVFIPAADRNDGCAVKPSLTECVDDRANDVGDAPHAEPAGENKRREFSGRYMQCASDPSSSRPPGKPGMDGYPGDFDGIRRDAF